MIRTLATNASQSFANIMQWERGEIPNRASVRRMFAQAGVCGILLKSQVAPLARNVEAVRNTDKISR